ncbi:hypothetical protein BGZ49_005259 [Haplosporangium sp. Z 27]|nr:hypothetical protein BGZ49_005259 [Haplosporangium sp. Z 27]
MEVNKDEAQRCLDIARRHLNSGNYAGARKFALKSISLYPTSEAEAFVKNVDKEETSASSSTKTETGTGTTGTKAGSHSTPTGTSSARPNTTTPLRSRSAPVDHKPVEREYTAEQAAAVKAIRSSGGDFYKVLGVKKDATDSDIKKAYRKVALQMHPDKNGAPGADEAFKIVSKAFTVLSDSQKRAIFDQHGPEEGRNSSVNYDRANPTGQQFAYSRRGMQGDEVSPEELFNMFFGGGSFGGSFHSTNGRSRTQQYHQRQEYFRQQHQFQRQQRANAANNGDLGSNFGSIIQLMPLLLLILITLSSSLFTSSDSGSHSSQGITNDFSLRPRDQYTTARHTTSRNVPYFVNDVRFMNTYFPGQQFEFRSANARQMNVKPDQVTQQGQKVGLVFKRMEENVEKAYLRMMQGQCKEEKRKKEVAQINAMGFWGADRKLWQEAQKMTLPSCDVIKQKYGKSYV